MYEFDAKIRFSEVDQDGKLSITGLLNYFQDCSTFQSEELGIGVKYLSKENKAWVINAWQIDVLRMPELCDEVIVGTIPYAIKGFMGSRNFYMKDKKTGDMIAKANSIWTFLDLEKLRPVRVEHGIAELYGIEDKLDMEYLDRKVIFEGEPADEAEAIVVNAHHLDANRHVNNGQYVVMAQAFLPETFTVSRLQVEYKKSALLGDVMIPKIYETSDSFGVSLVDEGGEAYTNIMFYRA